jgi:hypothetical protein
MQVDKLVCDQDKARELWRKYQAHRNYQSPHDYEIERIYKQLAQGKSVIRALESIRAAGVSESEGLPKLAIARADQALCYLHKRGSTVCFSNERNWFGSSRASRSKNITLDWPELPELKKWVYEAQVPLVPVHLRPKRGIENYHILWEAEWSRRYPVDPYLLRRFGGDAWLVVAAWDLTDVERAVMSQRVRVSN